MILAALLLATVTAVVGAGFGTSLGNLSRARLEMLVHVATGALLGITAFDILPEAKEVLSWPWFIGSALAGYALLWAVGRFVFFVCPSCALAHMDQDTALARRGSLILLASALGIHCLLDGLAIGAGSFLSSRAEAGAFLGVALHKLPEGLALGLLLVGSHYSRRSALAFTAGIESLTIVGGVAAMTFMNAPPPAVVGVLFAVVGGGFVYLVYNALGGALTHRMHVPRARTIAAELLTFVGTGALFWVAARL